MLFYSDYVDSSDILESSLNAKEKIISELNAELRSIENTLSSERETHVNELKKLTALLSEKVLVIKRPYCIKSITVSWNNSW